MPPVAKNAEAGDMETGRHGGAKSVRFFERRPGPLRHEHFVPCQEITTLAWLRPHVRDRHVQFMSEGHLCFVHGVQTHGSITGLIHAFVQPFDADTVIGS